VLAGGYAISARPDHPAATSIPMSTIVDRLSAAGLTVVTVEVARGWPGSP